MRSVVVFEHLTLDGVMQAPGCADEDRRGGFEHGGWATGAPVVFRPRCSRRPATPRCEGVPERCGDRDLPSGAAR
jgi:hypothetical protein